MSRSEERFPLIYSLHLDESDRAASPSPLPPVERSSSVTHGASAILSRWPGDLSPTWRLIVGAVGVAFITTGAILIMFYTTTALVPSAFPIPRRIVKRAAASASTSASAAAAGSCDDDDGGGVSDGALWSDLRPLEIQARFARDAHRIFFVHHTKNLTDANVCAVNSAHRIVNKTVYMILTMPPSSQATVASVAPSVLSVMYADPDSYFADTPLRGLDAGVGSTGRRLKDLALKVVTLWRYGGAAYDLGLVAVKRSGHVGVGNTTDDAATVSADGGVIVAHEPCHAFVYAIIRELAKIDLKSDSVNITVSQVIEQALVAFCGDAAGKAGCRGLHVLSDDRICAVGDEAKDAHCEWIRVDALAEDISWKKYCQ